MKQILYASINARSDGRPADVLGVLEQSRHNNALDGITGLLWTDGERFLQVLEGDDDAVDKCYARICADTRHKGIVTIVERAIDAREFGYWAMARRARGDTADEHDARVRRMLANAADEVRAPFLELVATREAA